METGFFINIIESDYGNSASTDNYVKLNQVKKKVMDMICGVGNSALIPNTTYNEDESSSGHIFSAFASQYNEISKPWNIILSGSDRTIDISLQANQDKKTLLSMIGIINTSDLTIPAKIYCRYLRGLDGDVIIKLCPPSKNNWTDDTPTLAYLTAVNVSNGDEIKFICGWDGSSSGSYFYSVPLYTTGYSTLRTTLFDTNIFSLSDTSYDMICPMPVVGTPYVFKNLNFFTNGRAMCSAIIEGNGKKYGVVRAKKMSYALQTE